MHENVAPHCAVDNHSITVFGRSTFDNTWGRRLCREGKGSQSVHNKVNPKHLNRSERGIIEDERAREHDEQGNYVDSHLELKEFSDVVESRAAVLDCTQNRAEIVIEELDIRCIFGNVSASDTHGKTNVRTVQSRCVIGSITSHSDSTTNFDQSVDKHELIIRLRSCHHFQFPFDFFEFSQIADRAFYADFIVL